MEYVTYLKIEPEFQFSTPKLEMVLIPGFQLSYRYNPGFIRDNYMDSLLNNLSLSNDTTTQQLTQSTQSGQLSQNLKEAILKHLGETYSQARRRENGYSDCSSFVTKVYRELGIDLGFTPSPGLWKKYVDHIDLNLVKPGDLVFLTYSRRHGSKKMGGIYREAGVTPSHVGIVVSVNGTELEIAENTGNSKSRINRYEVGNPSRRSPGVINYSKGSGRANEILGFGRLRV